MKKSWIDMISIDDDFIEIDLKEPKTLNEILGGTSKRHDDFSRPAMSFRILPVFDTDNASDDAEATDAD